MNPMQTGHSDVTTEGIRVRVGAQFLPDQSSPESQRFAYAYRVRIDNVGDRTAQLLRRHWVILDSDNGRREVKGEGVVGEQPVLAPGESFEYVSGATLATEWGTMEGHYRMVREDGTQFDAEVGRFFLTPTVAPLTALD
jgi:ApaG protein